MQFIRNDLDKLSASRLDIEEEVIIDFESLVNRNRIIALRDVFAVGHIYYDTYSTQLVTDLQIEGVMTVPCAITLEPFDLEFSTRLGEMFSFETPDEELASEIEVVDGEILDLNPYITEVIFAAVPLKAVHPDLEAYPEGSGWKVMTEEDYIKEARQEIDPRLAKLKDFKFE